MTYKPTPACPHPGCLNYHSIQRALTQFILVRFFFTGWLAFGVYAALSARLVAVSEPVRRAMDASTCGHWETRRWWTLTAILADMLMLGAQCNLTDQLIMRPRTPVIDFSLSLWAACAVWMALDTFIERLHRKATCHQLPETETEDAQ